MPRHDIPRPAMPLGPAIGSAAHARAASAPAPLQLEIDPSHRQIGVRASFLTAGAGLLGGATVLIVAFGLGRWSAPESATAAEADDAIVAAEDVPLVAGVLDLAGAESRSPLARPRPETLVAAATPGHLAATPLPVRTEPFRRVNGLNYVIVQSYPETERKGAENTRDALLEAGIDVTIERNIAGWGRRYCVVGTLGFEQMGNNAEFLAYVRQIEAVGQKHKGTKRFKPFDPVAVSWSSGD